MTEESGRTWDGRVAYVSRRPVKRHLSVNVELTTSNAHDLALVLRRLKGKPGEQSFLTAGLEELMQALDFVLVADPASAAAHRQMEASKGMEPSGG
jgi:hypothetical protein